MVATVAPVTVKSKAKRLQQVKEREHGIIYIGHLPYGFLEEGLKDYFTQFGQVLGSKVFRSKKVLIVINLYRVIEHRDLGL